MVRIAFSQNVMNVVMRNTVKVTWTVVPKDVNDGKVFQMGPSNIE